MHDTFKPRIWVELDDLIRYFDTAAVPAGIARVQLEILPRLLAAYPDVVRVCRVGRDADDVRELPAHSLVELLDGSKFLRERENRSFAAVRVGQWRRYISRKLNAMVDRWVVSGPARRSFRETVRPGDIILAMGASWTHPHFGRSLRSLKARHGVRFALLVHDVLPVSHPEHVHRGHIPTFERWLNEMTATWDLVLTPSKASAEFLGSYLRRAGEPIPPIRTIPFGFGFSNWTGEVPIAEPIEHDPYVLFVSTIEIRKNHALIYRVWERLLDKHGRDRVPKLIFAGNHGWGVEELWRMMNGTNLLGGKIRVVNNLSDAQIASAYRHARFSVFPSFCEGWGLPVSESIFHGKLCIASNATSIPEIGGAAVDYFDPRDDDAALAAVERALFEPGYVESREAWIRNNFKLPIWEDTARSIFQILTTTNSAPAKDDVEVLGAWPLGLAAESPPL